MSELGATSRVLIFEDRERGGQWIRSGAFRGLEWGLGKLILGASHRSCLQMWLFWCGQVEKMGPDRGYGYRREWLNRSLWESVRLWSRYGKGIVSGGRWAGSLDALHWEGEPARPVWGYPEEAQPKSAGQTLRVHAPLKLKSHFPYKSIWVLSLLRFISGNIFCFFQALKIVIFF